MEVTSTRPSWRRRLKLRTSNGTFGSNILRTEVKYWHTSRLQWNLVDRILQIHFFSPDNMIWLGNTLDYMIFGWYALFSGSREDHINKIPLCRLLDKESIDLAWLNIFI